LTGLFLREIIPEILEPWPFGTALENNDMVATVANENGLRVVDPSSTLVQASLSVTKEADGFSSESFGDISGARSSLNSL
jgi:hypothetical protein